jgi:hypothetical protein
MNAVYYNNERLVVMMTVGLIGLGTGCRKLDTQFWKDYNNSHLKINKKWQN